MRFSPWFGWITVVDWLSHGVFTRLLVRYVLDEQPGFAFEEGIIRAVLAVA